MFQRLGRRRLPRPAAPALAPAVIRPVTWRQLVLFHLPRDLTNVTSLSVFPDPPDPALAAALDQVVTGRAARHGWPKGVTGRARAGIRVLLALQDTPGAPI